MNEGSILHMCGNSMVFQQIGGKITEKSGQAILIYAQKPQKKLNEQIEFDINDILIKKNPNKTSKKIFDNIEE